MRAILVTALLAAAVSQPALAEDKNPPAKKPTVKITFAGGVGGVEEATVSTADHTKLGSGLEGDTNTHTTAAGAAVAGVQSQGLRTFAGQHLVVEWTAQAVLKGGVGEVPNDPHGAGAHAVAGFDAGAKADIGYRPMTSKDCSPYISAGAGADIRAMTFPSLTMVYALLMPLRGQTPDSDVNAYVRAGIGLACIDEKGQTFIVTPFVQQNMPVPEAKDHQSAREVGVRAVIALPKNLLLKPELAVGIPEVKGAEIFTTVDFGVELQKAIGQRAWVGIDIHASTARTKHVYSDGTEISAVSTGQSVSAVAGVRF